MKNGFYCRVVALVATLGSLVCETNGQTNTFPSSGNVGIGTTSPGAALDVVGNANFSGAVSGITTLGSTGLITTGNGLNISGNFGNIIGLKFTDTNTGGKIWVVGPEANTTAANFAIYNTIDGIIGLFTSTGLNSTAIGATTPSTGAFTTLSATGAVSLTGNSSSLQLTPVTGTSAGYILFTNTGGSSYVGMENSTGGNIITGSAAYGFSITSAVGRNLYLGANGGSAKALTIDTSQNATFAGTAAIQSSTASTSAATGALVVTGGLGVGGALNVGNSLTVGGNISAANITATGTLSASGATSFTNTGATTFAGPISSASGNLTVSSAGTSSSLLLNPSGGNVGIGTTNPQGTLHLQSTQQFYPQELIENIGNTGSGYLIFQKSRSGQTAITNGDGLGSVMFEGYSNGGYQQSVYLAAIADAVPSGSNVLSALTVNSRNSNGTLTEKFRISSNGNVGIGTANPSYLLSVSGTIQAKEVSVQTGWSDYVFDPAYRLAPLSEVERQIKEQGHLPGIPSAQEVAEHGVKTGEMEAKLLAKIEELTLHQIDQEKQLMALQSQNNELKAEVLNLARRLQ